MTMGKPRKVGYFISMCLWVRTMDTCGISNEKEKECIDGGRIIQYWPFSEIDFLVNYTSLIIISLCLWKESSL